MYREDVAFWDIHEQADREHSAIGRPHRRAPSRPRRSCGRRCGEAVVSVLTRHWWRFFDGIAGAVAPR